MLLYLSLFVAVVMLLADSIEIKKIKKQFKAYKVEKAEEIQKLLDTNNELQDKLLNVN